MASDRAKYWQPTVPHFQLLPYPEKVTREVSESVLPSFPILGV